MSITESGKPCKDWSLMKTWINSYPKSGLVGPFCRYIDYKIQYQSERQLFFSGILTMMLVDLGVSLLEGVGRLVESWHAKNIIK